MKNQNNLINHQKSKNVGMFKKGFTLVELLVVIAIIGVMSGVIIISVQGAVAKSKRASALTSASSILPELVTCQDDNGSIRACTSSNCSSITICTAAGHTTTKYPNITKTGWRFNVAATTNANIGTMTFTLTNPKYPNALITCTFASNECVDNNRTD